MTEPPARPEPVAAPFVAPSRVRSGLSAAALVEAAVVAGDGTLTAAGALACYTGARTGRSPKDKFVCRDAAAGDVDWGPVNRPIEPAAFAALADRVRAHLAGRPVWQVDAAAGADPAHRIRLRVTTETAWHALFADRLFLPVTPPAWGGFVPDWAVLHAPNLACDPARDGTHSDAVIAISFADRLVLIAGTHYAGEIKKAVFTVMNYLLPGRGVLPMHCAANVGPGGDVALFFGLSGTGKTTLSADPGRRLVGDDEHGWSDAGVFNVEGGCYAKTIRLSRAGEPQIWDAVKFGCVLENVPVDPVTREPDFASDAVTENTRAAYPLSFIPNAEPSGMGGHPANVVFLTCDAFGVLPPVARLTPDQAVDYFLCGYTAKVPGTEVGVTEPAATFSACFGAPFLPLAPRRYADMLRDRLAGHRVPVWLVNTGWAGGPFGTGRRMSLSVTRAVVSAVLSGRLSGAATRADPAFGLAVPTGCPGVPADLLDPRSTWADPSAYDRRSADLAGRFREVRATFG